MNSLLTRLIARLVLQLPDVEQFPAYQDRVLALRHFVMSRQPDVQIGPDVAFHPRFYYSRGVRLDLADGAEIKRDVRVGRDGEVHGSSTLAVGVGSQILSDCHLDCSADITIGAGTHIGRACSIYTHTHQTDSREVPILESPVKTAPVTIGSDVMIYSDVVILLGITIGDGAVVAIRSVVTRDVDPYSMVAGIPAEKVGERS